MASFQEIMDAAVNAEKAGDTEAARMLVLEAQRVRGDAVAPDLSPTELGVVSPRVGSEEELAAEAAQRTPAPDTFGPTINKAIAGPVEATKAAAAGLSDPSRSITGQALPEGMPAPFKRRLAGMGDMALTGINALGTGYAFGAGLVGETLGGSPTNERRLARDLMMAGAVAVPELAGVSSVARATVPQFTRQVKKDAKTSLGFDPAVTPKQEAARAADDLGITPSLGMTGKTGAMTAAGLEKVPLSGGVIGNDAARAVAEIEGAFHRINSTVGSAKTADRAGEVLQTGLGNFVTRVKTKANELFNNVREKVPADTKIETPETVTAIREALAPFESNPEIAKLLDLNKWAGMADALEKGLSWQAASALRTQIGESIGKLTGPLADMDGGRMKLAYAKLTDDLGAAAEAAGAGQEWKRSQAYYKAQAQRIKKQLDKLIKPDTPERAFEIFDAATKGDRSTSDLNRLRAIKQSLKPEEWNDISASLVERLGKATAGTQNAAGDAFSPSTFLTNWNKLSPEGKRLLLPEESRFQLEKLAKVAESAKAANAERNFSNTGTAAGWLATIFGTSIDMGMTGAALGGSLLSAKGLTNPTFLRAMNNAARGDVGQLKAMASGRGPFAKDASTILRLMAAEASLGDPANKSTPPSPSRAMQ